MNPIDAASRPLSRGEVRPGDGQPGGSARWPRRWIASVVALHFLASLVAALPAESPVWRLSAPRHLRLAYVSHSLDQRWTMFAPPPRQDYSIHAALRLPEGWTEMFRLDGFASTRLRGVIFQPRGLFRLRSFLRPSSRDLDGLHDRSFRAFY
jgi:hypothetical protein